MGNQGLHRNEEIEPFHQRRWVRLAALFAIGLILGLSIEHFIVHPLTESHASNSNAASTKTVTETVTETEQVIPDACLKALSEAENGLKLGSDHIDDMTKHIEETGTAGRHHLEEMRPIAKELHEIRDRFEKARLACELPSKPEATRSEQKNEQGGVAE